MKALTRRRYGGTDTLDLEELAVPVPGRGEVLVRVEAAGVNRADHHAMTGMPVAGRAAFGLRRPRQPILGMDLVGTVEALGGGVEGLAIGERVLGVGSGAFAEFALAKADLLVPAPATLEAASLAALPTSGMTALDALDAAGDISGARVIITGAGGGVGTTLVALAVEAGAQVIAVCSAGKAEAVRALGAAEVVDYRHGDPEPGSADVVIEFGGARTVAALRALVGPRGRVVIGGGEDAGRILGPARRMMLPRRGVRGLFSAARREKLERLVVLAEAGVLPIPVEVLPLARGAEALARLERGGVVGKLVLRP